ncbi:hypothetical protein ABZT47_28940 [Sphaerisporangium sp. NPDC005289]|uniref:hypothetical protein n=1 Tax=Sphaerisporangium sp. NPDC005289 TaxID=3155247 RepID=UPI0033AADA1B
MSAIGGLAARLGTLAVTGMLVVAQLGASAAVAADTTLTEASDGTTVTVSVGQSVTVTLPASYDPITTSGAALTRTSGGGGFPTGRPLTATYLAGAAGTADLRTQTDYTCLHTVPRCTVPQRRWLVHVIVVPANPTTTVTEGDSERTVSLRVGDTLVVSLPRNYQPTKLTGPALSLRQLSGGFPTGQPLTATYSAAQPGTVDVVTMTDDPCLHTTPGCTIPQRQWIVHVLVTS